jgi:hypothetical protein
LLGELRPHRFDGGQAQVGEHKFDARGVDGIGRSSCCASIKHEAALASDWLTNPAVTRIEEGVLVAESLADAVDLIVVAPVREAEQLFLKIPQPGRLARQQHQPRFELREFLQNPALRGDFRAQTAS